MATAMERKGNLVYVALVLAAVAAIWSAPPGDLNERTRLLLLAMAGPEMDMIAGAVGSDVQLFAAP
jgi:hypothetical protein